MQIQVNTDARVEGREALLKWVEVEVAERLARFRDRVTRIEVHLSDSNGDKSGAKDKRCVMEARPNGLPPLAASFDAATVADAFTGAAEKLKHALDHALERSKDRRGRDSIRGEGHTPDDAGGAAPPH
jgi:ribosome-associated translation inhibitor RaiA